MKPYPFSLALLGFPGASNILDAQAQDSKLTVIVFGRNEMIVRKVVTFASTIQLPVKRGPSPKLICPFVSYAQPGTYTVSGPEEVFFIHNVGEQSAHLPETMSFKRIGKELVDGPAFFYIGRGYGSSCVGFIPFGLPNGESLSRIPAWIEGLPAYALWGSTDLFYPLIRKVDRWEKTYIAEVFGTRYIVIDNIPWHGRAEAGLSITDVEGILSERLRPLALEDGLDLSNPEAIASTLGGTVREIADVSASAEVDFDERILAISFEGTIPVQLVLGGIAKLYLKGKLRIWSTTPIAEPDSTLETVTLLI